MAVLGTNGRIILSRNAPAPVVVKVADFSIDKKAIQLPEPSFRTGDLVEVISVNNWPNTFVSDTRLVPTYADFYQHRRWKESVDTQTPYSVKPESYAFFATQGGDNLTTQDSKELYGIFAKGEDVTYYRNQLYVHVDQLNRMSFYRTRSAALVGANNASREGITLDYFIDLDADMEFRLVNEWKIECMLQSWELSLNGNEIDTTGLGDKFFDGVKSLIRGGGSFDFLVERQTSDPRNTTIVNRADYANARCFVNVYENNVYADADIIGTSGSLSEYGPDYTDASLNAGSSSYDNANILPRDEIQELDAQQIATVGTSNLMQLLLSTEDQAEADAEFWMIDSDLSDQVSHTYQLLEGDLYYRTKIMLTNTAISTRPTDIITGSANFVTVRDVELLEGAR